MHAYGAANAWCTDLAVQLQSVLPESLYKCGSAGFTVIADVKEANISARLVQLLCCFANELLLQRHTSPIRLFQKKHVGTIMCISHGLQCSWRTEDLG